MVMTLHGICNNKFDCTDLTNNLCYVVPRTVLRREVRAPVCFKLINAGQTLVSGHLSAALWIHITHSLHTLTFWQYRNLNLKNWFWLHLVNPFELKCELNTRYL